MTTDFTLSLEDYAYTDIQVRQRAEALSRFEMTDGERQEAYRFILGVIDLTSLSGADNRQTVAQLCRKGMTYRDDARDIRSPGAVCVYPPFVAVCKDVLGGSGVRVASVAGAFPSGQSPIEVKVAEVRYAVAQGADEIDTVISRGTFIEGGYQTVYDEIRVVRAACGQARLKVILETGELKTVQNIYRAAQIAIAAGADFIKTSTGKIEAGATPEAFLVMTDAVRRHYEKTGRKVGIKPAGGVADPETALLYVHILSQTLGRQWLTPEYFRIGASRLADKTFALINGTDK